MAKEIERKFLIKENGFWDSQARGARIVQGYLSFDPERTVRVRISDGKGFLTIKGKSVGISRDEYEYPIPVDEAEALLKLCLPSLIDKTRYRIEFGGHCWEVDRFHGDNEGLLLAEVELKDEDEVVELPPWLGKEVSHDSRFFNAALAKNPFTHWLAESFSSEALDRLFSSVIADNLEKLIEAEPVAEAGDNSEGVHQLRVALRRMRTALSLAGKGRNKGHEKALEKELRWAAKELDYARDLDVYLERFFDSGKLQDEQSALLVWVMLEQKKACQLVRDLIGSSRYQKMKTDLKILCVESAEVKSDSEGSHSDLQKDLIKFAEQVVKRRLSRFVGEGAGLEKANEKQLHRLRLECKKLRYALEFFTQPLGAWATKRIVVLKSWQDKLGDFHDYSLVPDMHQRILKDVADPQAWEAAHNIEEKAEKAKKKLFRKLTKKWPKTLAKITQSKSGICQ